MYRLTNASVTNSAPAVSIICLCRGLEKALDHYSQPPASAAAAEAGGADEKGKDARRNLMREKRKKALKHLSVPERDVLTVLSAVCKVARCLCVCKYIPGSLTQTPGILGTANIVSVPERDVLTVLSAVCKVGWCFCVR